MSIRGRFGFSAAASPTDKSAPSPTADKAPLPPAVSPKLPGSLRPMGQLVKQGWMSKQGGGHREKSSVMKSFSQLSKKRRFFEFDGRTLAYYKTDGADKERIGDFDLSEGFQVEKGESGWGFEIILRHNQVSLFAESRKDREDWMSVLKRFGSSGAFDVPRSSQLINTHLSTESISKLAVDSDGDAGAEVADADDEGKCGDTEGIQMAAVLAACRHKGRLFMISGKMSQQKMWKRSWFVLAGTKLYFVKWLEDAEPLGVIDLTECESAVSAEDLGVPCAFVIKHAARSYNFYADSLEERAQWLGIIEAVRADPAAAAAWMPPAAPVVEKQQPVVAVAAAPLRDSASVPPSRTAAPADTEAPDASDDEGARAAAPTHQPLVLSSDDEAAIPTMRSHTSLLIPPQHTPVSEERAAQDDAYYMTVATQQRNSALRSDNDRERRSRLSSTIGGGDSDSSDASLLSPTRVEFAIPPSEPAARDPSTLFRLDSLASKVMKKFAHSVGGSYLRAVLAAPIAELSASAVSCEVDESRIAADESIEGNRERLVEVVDSFLSAILGARSEMPSELESVCKHLYEEVGARYPGGKSASKAVGGFLFLRYFCPALAQPAAFDLLSTADAEAPRTKRALVLVTKVLQNLANGVEFGSKEGFMVWFNGVVGERSRDVEAYLSSFARSDERPAEAATPVEKAPAPRLTDIVQASSQLADRLEDALRLDMPSLLVRLGGTRIQEANTVLSNMAARPDQFVDLLVEDEGGMPLLSAICSTTAASERDRLADNLFFIFMYRDRVLPLLYWLITDEVRQLGGTARKFDVSVRSVANLPAGALTAGSLRKIGGNYKTWHQRWFVLTFHTLSYFKTSEDITPKGVIDITKCSAVRPVDADLADVEYGFEVVTADRIYLFAADSAEECHQWVDEVGRVIHRQFAKRSTALHADRPSSVASVKSVSSTHSAVDPAVAALHKEGYLMKRGDLIKTWKRRFFILHNGRLKFYREGDSDTDPTGALDMRECARVERTSQRGFQLELTSNTVDLVADTESDLQDWLEILLNVLWLLRPSLRSAIVRSVGGEASAAVADQAAAAAGGASPSEAGAYVPVITMSRASTVMSGWLTKEGGVTRTWKNRWFVLRGHHLVYFKDPHEASNEGLARGTINLLGVSGRGVRVSEFAHPRFPFCFTVGDEGDEERTYYMVARSKSDMTMWVNGLQSQIASALGTRRTSATSPSMSALSSTSAAASIAAPPTTGRARLGALSRLSMASLSKTISSYAHNTVASSSLSAVVGTPALMYSVLSDFMMKASTSSGDREQVTKWKSRFVVLKAGMLAYYKTPTDDTPINVILLGDTTVHRIAEHEQANGVLANSKNPNTHGAGFVIVSKRKYYYMVPSTEESVEAWVDAIRRESGAAQTGEAMLGASDDDDD